MEVEGKEENLEIDTFIQPPAVFKDIAEDGTVSYRTNPDAENLENLKGGTGYYARQVALRLSEGRDDIIDSLFCQLDVVMRDGKGVFPMFKPDLHIAKGRLEPIDYQPLVVGFDSSGLHPAAVMVQHQVDHWCVIDELAGYEGGLQAFFENGLVPLLRGKYNRCEVVISCDPANARDNYFGLAPTEHLTEYGFSVDLPVTNEPTVRIRAVSTMLNKNEGGLLVSPHCKQTIAALSGGYHFKRMKLVGAVENVFSTRPEKNEASHIADSLQYACMFIVKDTYRKSGMVHTYDRKLSDYHKLLRSVMI
jgi:hypothetical protein